MAVTYSPAVVSLQAAVDTVLTRDLRDVPECTRLNELEAMLEAREALTTAIAHAVQVIDAADTTVAETGRSTRCWLTETQHLNPTAASRLRRLAVQLPGYPNLDAALRARKFSTEHAHVILRVMRAVPAGYTEIVETALLELAQHMTPDDLAKEAETLLVACGVESSSDAEQRRLTSRGVRIAPLLDGMHRIDGLLTPETTEALKLIFAQHATPAGDEDDRTVPQRQHDALADVLHQHLAYAPMADVNGERPRIVITIDYTTLERDLRDAWGELPSGIRVSPHTVRRLACDAELLPAVLGCDSAVLDIANKTQRCFTHAVKRAAWIEQHGRCAFRGCRRPPTDAHHIIWWTHGGQSVLDNAAWLCTFHHWLVHDGGWTMRRDPDRSFVFTSPTGDEIRRHPSAA